MRLGRSAAAALALVAALSCFSDRSSTTGPLTGECRIPADAFERNRAVVIVRAFSFRADTVRIRPGGTVTWVNCEDPEVDPHTTTSTTGVWDSGLLQPGESFAHTFPAAGTFPYFCIPHTFMQGAVIVE
jgi:plastocyanin